MTTETGPQKLEVTKDTDENLISQSHNNPGQQGYLLKDNEIGAHKAKMISLGYHR
jgi:hypothetical protein